MIWLEYLYKSISIGWILVFKKLGNYQNNHIFKFFFTNLLFFNNICKNTFCNQSKKMQPRFYIFFENHFGCICILGCIGLTDATC